MPSAQKKSPKKPKKSIKMKARTRRHARNIPAMPEEKPGLKRYAFFNVGKQNYAIDVDRVIEVLHQYAIEPVAHLPDAFLGVIHLRGVSIPVIDLPQLLREEKLEGSEKTCIIAMLGHEQIGLLIDSDIEIIMSDECRVHTLPDCYTKEEARFIDGILALDDTFMAILNPDGMIQALTDWKAADAAV